MIRSPFGDQRDPAPASASARGAVPGPVPAAVPPPRTPLAVESPLRWHGEISPMVALFLPAPGAGNGAADGEAPWESDVLRATESAQGWMREGLDAAQVAAWLAAWPEAQPRVAAGFSRAGIGPAAAMTPLWYGRVNPGRRPLAVRVATGDVTLGDAIAQLRVAGLAG